jgi:molybdopterin-biosynthesis enzyme MoeA-like protein
MTQPAGPRGPVVINLGDEVLLGESPNGNQRWMLQTLSEQGLAASLALCLPDDVAIIGHWVQQLRDDGYGPIFASGGIGGTHDDHTREGIAVGLSRPLRRHDRCHQILAAKYGARFTEQRQRMAWLPEGSRLIDNPIGAPGFAVQDVYAFPGFPQMLQPMMLDVLSWTESGARQPAWIAEEYRLPCAEGEIAMAIETFAAAHHEAKIGIYPSSEHFAQEVTLRIRCAPDCRDTLSQFARLVADLERGLAT